MGDVFVLYGEGFVCWFDCGGCEGVVWLFGVVFVLYREICIFELVGFCGFVFLVDEKGFWVGDVWGGVEFECEGCGVVFEGEWGCGWGVEVGEGEGGCVVEGGGGGEVEMGWCGRDGEEGVFEWDWDEEGGEGWGGGGGVEEGGEGDGWGDGVWGWGRG